jgi:excisionase family DNA binding protein
LEQLLIGVRDAAAALGLSHWTVRKHIRSGKIRTIRIGRRVLVEPRELKRVIEDGQVKTEDDEVTIDLHDLTKVILPPSANQRVLRRSQNTEELGLLQRRASLLDTLIPSSNKAPCA